MPAEFGGVDYYGNHTDGENTQGTQGGSDVDIANTSSAETFVSELELLISVKEYLRKEVVPGLAPHDTR